MELSRTVTASGGLVKAILAVKFAPAASQGTEIEPPQSSGATMTETPRL
jgi:hypothetical protein